VSSARNRGIDESTGDWLMMIDPDDVVDRSYVSSCIKAANLSDFNQVVFCEFQIVNKNNINITPRWDKGIIEYSKSESLKIFLSRKSRFIVTGMLVNRTFLMKNQITFDEKCRYSEDVQFVWKVLSRLDKAILIKKPLYNYFLRPDSTMTSSKLEKIITGYYALDSLYKNYIDKMESDDLIKIQFIPRYVMALLHSASRILHYRDFIKLADIMEAPKHFLLYKKSYDNKIYFLTKFYLRLPYAGYIILRNF
jgi:glycosyltransferase involved in cell wall biosynthesis